MDPWTASQGTWIFRDHISVSAHLYAEYLSVKPAYKVARRKTWLLIPVLSMLCVTFASCICWWINRTQWNYLLLILQRYHWKHCGVVGHHTSQGLLYYKACCFALCWVPEMMWHFPQSDLTDSLPIILCFYTHQCSYWNHTILQECWIEFEGYSSNFG